MAQVLQVRFIYFGFLSEITEVRGTCLNSTSCVCLATDVQRKPDSVAPKTGQRLMICDSFNEPGYEQSSCSPYISRNSCCFSRVFDFIFLYCGLKGEGTPITRKQHGQRLYGERAKILDKCHFSLLLEILMYKRSQ